MTIDSYCSSIPRSKLKITHFFNLKKEKAVQELEWTKSVKSLHMNRTNACTREPDKHECLQNLSSLFCSNKDNSTVKIRCSTISTLIAEPDTVKQELSLTWKEQNHKLLFPYLEHDWLQEGNQQLLPQVQEQDMRISTEVLENRITVKPCELQQAESPIRSSGAERIRWWHLNTQQDLGITEQVI